MSDRADDFEPEAAAEREIAGDAATDRSDFLSLMGNAYRGEISRASAWRTRIDRTTNWAVVVTATLLTWTFADTRPHYILLAGTVMVTVFLGIESRRYRVYDVWRSRVRLLEENVLANALEPDGVEQSDWRRLLSEDLRDPTIKTPRIEAISRRLYRVYFPLISILLSAWAVRITVFTPASAGLGETAAIGGLSGTVVVLLVGVFYAIVLGLVLWPTSRRAKGEFETETNAEWR